MSTTTVAKVKRWCRIVHSADDVLFQDLIDGAEGEMLTYLERTQPPTLPIDDPEPCSSEDVPSSEDPAAPEWHTAICILVQARYEGQSLEDQAAARVRAEVVLYPFRRNLGV